MNTKTNVQEIWKPVKEYEGIYEVSNYGNLRSLDRKTWNHYNKSYTTFKGQKIKASVGNTGYNKASLYKDKKQKDVGVHRLVAEAFLPNPKNKPTVNHKDENRSHNYLDNLEWATYSENNNHGNRNKTVSRKLKSSILCKEVHQYDKNGNYIRSWDSLSKASRNGGYRISGMSLSALGIRETHKGYIWSYEKR